MGTSDQSQPATRSPYASEHFANILSALRDPQHPTQIGPYVIDRLIGEGGMGSVYKAEQREPIRRIVAIKVIKLGMDTRQVIARFESERQALAVMDHPNVARVIDAGATETGRPFFVMEYVDGDPITAFCDRHRYTLQQRLELFQQACEAVQHAHQKAIIHRDLKPSNLLVTLKDDVACVKVIDFGVAKALNQQLTERTMFTETGLFLGTPEYMAPEQAEGSANDVDTRTDVYSLGIVLYELLIGALPFDAATLRSHGYSEIQRIIREVDAPRPSTKLSSLGETAQDVARMRQTELGALHKQLDNELEWIPLKAMRKEPAQRYSSPRELAEDIDNYISQRPLRAGPESRAYRAKKFLRRNKTGVATAAVMLILLLGGITATTWQAVRATRAEHKTRAALEHVEAANVTVSDVNEFLVNLLHQADPYQSKGQKVTVLEALDAAAGRIASSLDRQPLAEASIRAVLSTAYAQLNRADLAVPHARAAVDIRRRLLGNDNVETFQAINQLAFALKKQSKFKEAEPLYREAVAGCRRLLGDDDPTTLMMISNLATLIADQGRFDEATPMHQSVLEKRRRILGNEHKETYQSLNNVGSCLTGQHKLKEAEAIYREALDRPRKSIGDDHPDTLKILNNLAIVLAAQDKNDEAEGMFRESWTRSRRVLGEEHIDTLVSEESMASFLQEQGKLTEATPLFRHALETALRTVGPDHFQTLTFEHNLAALLQDQGNLDQAESMFRDVLERRRRILPPEHPGALATRHRLAILLRQRGRLSDSEAEWRELVEVRRRVAPDHPDTLSSTFGLVLVLRDQGKFGEAEQMCRELGTAVARVLGDTHRNTLGVKDALAGILLEEGKFDEAEPIFRAVLDARKQTLGDSNPATITTLAEYGICLAKLKRFDEAIKPLAEARAAMRGAGDRNIGLSGRVLAALVETTTALNLPADAERWRAELGTLRAATQPTSRPG